MSLGGSPDDAFLFRFKKVSIPNSGMGTIITAFDAGPDSRYGGIVIRQHLKSLKGEGGKISYCGAVKGNNTKAFHIYRTSDGTNSIREDSILSTQANFLKVEITSTTVKCFYSKDVSNPSFTKLGSTIPISFTGSFYAGFANFDPLDGLQVASETFSKIEFTGFSGFCNNHGECKYDPSTGKSKLNS
jgi:hypothetical protein